MHFFDVSEIIKKINKLFTANLKEQLNSKITKLTGLTKMKERMEYINFNKKILGKSLINGETSPGDFVNKINECYNNDLKSVFNNDFERRLEKSLKKYKKNIVDERDNWFFNNLYERLDLSTFEIQLILHCNIKSGKKELGDKDIIDHRS